MPERTGFCESNIYYQTTSNSYGGNKTYIHTYMAMLGSSVRKMNVSSSFRHTSKMRMLALAEDWVHVNAVFVLFDALPQEVEGWGEWTNMGPLKPAAQLKIGTSY